MAAGCLCSSARAATQEPERGEKVTVLCPELFRIGQNVEGFDIFRIRLTVVKGNKPSIGSIAQLGHFLDG